MSGFDLGSLAFGGLDFIYNIVKDNEDRSERNQERWNESFWNNKNFNEAQRQFDENMAWQKYNSQNRYQDMVNDLKKAGMNPVLATGSQPYNPNSVSNLSNPNVGHRPSPRSGVGEALRGIMSNTAMMAQVDQDDKLKQAQADYYRALATKTGTENDIMSDKESGTLASNKSLIDYRTSLHDLNKANQAQIENYIEHESPEIVKKYMEETRELEQRKLLEQANRWTENALRGNRNEQLRVNIELQKAEKLLKDQQRLNEWLDMNAWPLEQMARQLGVEKKKLENALATWDLEATKVYGQRSDVPPDGQALVRMLEHAGKNLAAWGRVGDNLWDYLTSLLHGVNLRYNLPKLPK